MTKPIPSIIFEEAKADRNAKHPFEHISAYKVRECRDSIARMLDTLTEVISVVSAGDTHPQPILLGGCTTGDKAKWLKDLPNNLARELGYNLIPAIEALSAEGVPESAINAFLEAIEPSVEDLLADCDAVQAATSRSINGEYQKMKTGCSEMLGICQAALAIAEKAVALCETHGV
ncbi:MAG: hypothetical protein ACK440_08300 [Sphingomonadaceae bacterium]|jgi:hypothetical protein